MLPELACGDLDTWIVTHENLRELPRVRAVFEFLVEASRYFARTSHPARGQPDETSN